MNELAKPPTSDPHLNHASSVIKEPVQERSAATLERIVAAARALLAERDFDAISVDEIVAEAGSSKGSFYARFPDKRSLLVHLLRQEHAAAVGMWSELLQREQWTERPLAEAVDALVDRLLEIYLERRHTMRAFAGEVFDGDGEVRELSVRLNRHVLELLRAVFEDHRAELGHPVPDRAAAFLLTALITLLPPLFLSPNQALFPAPFTDEELAAEVRRLCHCYLGTE